LSGPEFDSLFYTDCVPGQGLRGGAGFQFQAVSPGVSHDTMALVQRTMLYEAPVGWMREQRAVADYPPSLTHVFDGVYATARGCYLGAEANGVREGNQFTHAIAATDPEAYGLTRPAQLWDATWWSDKSAPTTVCERLAADPEMGPWGIDTLREWVLGQPDGEDWLLAVHSAFDRIHDADGRRVLFVGDDASTVLGWIAAGTVLMAQSRALRVGFRVFATNPRQSRHDVLAVHDDWAGSFGDPRRDNGFIVFNLTTGEHSAVEPTDGARYWVSKFLRADPYDALDAIELAQRFAGSESRPSSADRLAAAVVALGGTPDGPEQAVELVDWLHSTPAVLTEDVVQPAVDAALAFRLDIGTLRTLHAAVGKRRAESELADRVLRALFAAELEDVTGIPAGGRDGTPLGALAEAAANAVAPEHMDALLLVATRFGVEPRVGGFIEGASRFVRWWADHPVKTISPARWSVGAQMIDLLRDELADRLARPGNDRTYEDIRRHWWRIVLSTATDPAAPLDATASAAAVADGEPSVRRDTVVYVLGALRDAPARQRGGLMWRALFTYSPPQAEELVAYLRELPPGGLIEWWADHVVEGLDRLVGSKPSAAALDALALAFRLGGAIPAKGRLTDLVQQDETLKRWLDIVAAKLPQRPAVLRPVTQAVLAARVSEFVETLLESLPLADAIKVVERGSDGIPAAILPELSQRWQNRDEPVAVVDAAVALGFLTVHVATCAGSLALKVERELQRWVKAVDKPRLLRIGRLLQEADERGAEEWRQFTGVRATKTVTTGQAAHAKRGQAPAKDALEDKGAGWRFGRRNKNR
jgi:hypothetical protein